MSTEARAIDELDRSIVERLRRDGRETNRSLATALGVNEATIATRLRRLETNNVMHVVALTDMQRLGFPFFAFVMITVAGRPILAVAAEIAAVPQTIFVNVHCGRFDVICGVLARDQAEFGEVIGEAIPKIKGVATVRCELAVDVPRFDSAWAALGAGGDLGKQPRPAVPPEAVDELDLRIIGALQRDARISNRSVAAELDVSEGTVRGRLRRMEEDNLIRIRAVSDIEAFGLSAAAVVGVHVADGRIAATAKALQALDGVAAIIRSVGEFDFILIMLAETRPALLDIVLTRIHAIKGIRSTETFEAAGVLKHIYTWVRLVDGPYDAK
jgi:DNA-binding Lrp family transcriptional regulator